MDIALWFWKALWTPVILQEHVTGQRTGSGSVAPKAGEGRIGLPEDSGLGALALSVGIDGENWVENEFGGAPLGDKRLSRRLVEIGADKAEKPGRAYSGVAEGDWPIVTAYYRLTDKPDDSAVTMANILLPHREQTI